MPRKKVERDKNKVHPIFYRPKEVRDFEDFEEADRKGLELEGLLSEWGVVSGGAPPTDKLPTPTSIEIISYIFHKSYTGEDVVDYTIEVPTVPATIGFDIRLNIS